MDLVKPAEKGQHFVEPSEMLGRKAAGPVGGEGDCIDMAIGEVHRHGHVVGGALGLQFGEDGKIQDRVRALQASP